MHLVRWALTTGWILIILSLLYDPFTPRFTAPDHPWSPLRIPADCVTVQGVCLNETPYPLGTTLFWGLVVPSGIFILLVFGYFVFCYVYAGNWEYYFSGIWLRQNDQLAQLLRPGFFLFGQPIDVPRLVALPLFLGLCTWLGTLAGRAIESALRRRVRRAGAEPDRERIRHRVFVVATFLVFNFFFLFAGRPAGRCCCCRRPGSSTSST